MGNGSKMAYTDPGVLKAKADKARADANVAAYAKKAQAEKAAAIAKARAEKAKRDAVAKSMAKPKPNATKCTCPGGGKTDPTCPIHGL